MTSEFRESLARLAVSESIGLSELLEYEEERFYDEAGAEPTDVTVEATFDGLPPPTVLSGSFDTLEGLKAIIEPVDIRWRLDALMALVDILADHES